jgi:hypothetical protein
MTSLHFCRIISLTNVCTCHFMGYDSGIVMHAEHVVLFFNFTAYAGKSSGREE